MKKILLFVASLLAFGVITAQVAKTPLIEHFTSASCPPCATQNALMKPILDNYSGNYVKVSHQGNYSYDPMEDNFPLGSSVRHAAYGGGGVPHTALNGSDGYPSTMVTAATLAGIASQTTPYEITVTQTWQSATSIDVTVVVANTTGADISTANKIFISMVEETVTFPSPPGSNGESQFHWVLRQMYDGTGGANATAGSALGTILANGNQTFTFNVTPPSYISDLNQVSFAAYIQSATTNDMEQAGKSTKGGVPGLLDLATTTNSVVGAGYCNYSFDPVINFTNNSPAIPVTQVIVEYDINGGAPVQETYNGNLTQGQSTAIAFPNTSLAPGISTINYNVVSVNGGNAYSGGSVAMAPETFAKINATSSSTPISEGFQGPDEEPAPAGAIADNPNGITAQTVSSSTTPATSSLGGHGNSDGCFLWYFYGIQSGSSKLIFEKRDFSGTSGNQLTFSHAYAQYQNESDQLQISVSTDCGATWTSVWNKSGTTLATVPAQTAEFWPNANQWVDNTVDLSAYDNEPEVMIAFEGISAYGNSLFIDDINTTDASTPSWDCDSQGNCSDPGTGAGQYTSLAACNAVCSATATTEAIANLSVYPNPVKDVLTIEGSYTSVDIFDIFGKLVLSSEYVKTINVKSLADGVYMLNINTEKGIQTKKITITK